VVQRARSSVVTDDAGVRINQSINHV